MKLPMPANDSYKYLQALQYVVFGSIILYFGKSLFIPFSFALLISFILYPVCAWIERKSFKRITAIFIAMSLLTLLIGAIVALLAQQFVSFLEEWPAVKPKLLESLDLASAYLFDKFAVTREQQNLWLKQIVDTNVIGFIKDTLSAGAFSAVLAIMVPILSILILYYRKRLVGVVYGFMDVESRIDLKKILGLSIIAYYEFIKGMLIVYFIVGSLNSLGLWIMGVPYALLFGYVAAILTFIPYIGIMIGSLLPVAMSWVTYNSIWYPVGVISLFAFVQYLEANIIFPIAVSNRLKINALVTLVAIIIGGILWGVAGMILFVPFLAIAKLVAENHPKLKNWSLLLGTSEPNDTLN